FTGQVASALASDGDGVLVGTGFEGEIWRFIEDGGARLATIDAVQATAFAESGNAAVVQGPAGVLWPAAGPDVDSGFRAPSLRLARPARFGEYRVLPDDETVRIRFRSGASDKPDENWLGWSDWLPAHGSVPKPPAKSLQWEVRSVANGGKFLSVDRVEVSYREVNVGPRIVSVEVESPGVVYLGSPPPSGPVIDASNPDFSGIFSVLQPDGGGGASKPRQGKKYWRVGYRTVVWKAEDDNGDPLSHEVEVEAKDGFRLSVRKRLTTTQLGVDTTALPDGLYRFRITASDKPNNPEAPLDTTAVGRWYTVDNTPPEIRATRQEEIWQIEISDAASPIKRVEWSRDGAPWEVLEPVDGMLDGATEQFSFPVSEGRHLVVVRAIDRHHNRTVEGIVEEP
ncbi:MAG: hypothetical protein GY906_00655, partial [bacterium]|nr:hypothetical protein [bacterium]